jgi:hypothetical protein
MHCFTVFRLRQFVEQVTHFMESAKLLLDEGKDSAERCPKAQCAIPNRQRKRLQTVPLQVAQHAKRTIFSPRATCVC